MANEAQMTVLVEVNASAPDILRDLLADRLAQVTVAMHRDCQHKVRLANRDGWTRSQPGESPHTSEGGPHRGIVRAIDKARMYFAIGLTSAAKHLFFQEVGTRPHEILPVIANMLRIPWRAEGRGKREPTKEEIERIGLVFRGGQWIFFRKRVWHPGQEPRPWLVQTIMDNIDKYRAILAGDKGDAVDVSITKRERPT